MTYAPILPYWTTDQTEVRTLGSGCAILAHFTLGRTLPSDPVRPVVNDSYRSPAFLRGYPTRRRALGPEESR